MKLVTPNLLVTDDDQALRETLGEVLRRRGFNVTLAADGEEALQLLRGRPVHLALVDVHMPRVTGLQMLAQMQAEAARVPCILMSAALDETIRQEAERMQVYRVLSKPIRLAELSRTVQQTLADLYGWAG